MAEETRIYVGRFPEQVKTLLQQAKRIREIWDNHGAYTKGSREPSWHPHDQSAKGVEHERNVRSHSPSQHAIKERSEDESLPDWGGNIRR